MALAHTEVMWVDRSVPEFLDVFLKGHSQDFPGGPAVKNPAAGTGDTGSIPGPGRSHVLRGS